MSDTFTDAEMHALWQDILERMLKAGWVHRFAHSRKRGWHVETTAPGLQRITLLRDLVTALKLTDDDRGALAFDAMVRGKPLEAVTFFGPRNSAVDEFWRESVDALGIAGDTDRLLVFAHVVTTYGAQPGKEIVFLPQES